MFNWRKSLIFLLAMVACAFSFAWAGGEAETKEEDDFFKDKPAVASPTTPADKDTLRVNTLIVKDAKIDKAEIAKAEIELAKIKKALIRKASIKEAEVKSLKVQMANFEKAHFEYACMKQAEVDLLKVKLAEIETANIRTANIETANINVANVNRLNSGGAGYSVRPSALPCTNPPCGDRFDNPNWYQTGEATLGEFRLVYGRNKNVKKQGTLIQSKIRYDGSIHAVVTNWDGVEDIALRLNRAHAALVELRNKNVSPNCGKDDCHVCEH